MIGLSERNNVGDVHGAKWLFKLQRLMHVPTWGKILSSSQEEEGLRRIIEGGESKRGRETRERERVRE